MCRLRVRILLKDMDLDALVYRWRKPYSFITIRDSSTYIGALHPQCITYKKKKRTRGDGPTTKKNTGGGRTNKMEYVQGATYKNIIRERGNIKDIIRAWRGHNKHIFNAQSILCFRFLLSFPFIF